MRPTLEVPDATRDVETGRPTERRAAPRCPTSLMPSITGLRLSPCGGQTSLVNISSTGLLLKSNAKLGLGARVTVVFEGTFSPSSITSRVARCVVTDIDTSGVLWYHVGATFDHPIELEAAPATDPQPEPAPQPLKSPVGHTVLTNRW